MVAARAPRWRSPRENGSARPPSSSLGLPWHGRLGRQQVCRRLSSGSAARSLAASRRNSSIQARDAGLYGRFGAGTCDLDLGVGPAFSLQRGLAPSPYHCGIRPGSAPTLRREQSIVSSRWTSSIARTALDISRLTIRFGSLSLSWRNIGAIIGLLVVELWKLDHGGSTLPAPVGSSRLNNGQVQHQPRNSRRTACVC
jgi:hypothetical protein